MSGATKEKGWGRGILEGLGDALGAAAAPRVLMLRVDEIAPDPNQPRSGLTDADCESLAESIRLFGRVIKPIVVRKTESGYVIADGERRWRASRLAGKTDIPALVAAPDDDILALQLLANQEHRHLSNVEIARAVALLDQRKRKNSEIATLVAVPEQTLKHYRRLLDLPPEIEPVSDRGSARAIYELTLALTEHRSAVTEFLDQLSPADEITLADVRRIIGKDNRPPQERVPVVQTGERDEEGRGRPVPVVQTGETTPTESPRPHQKITNTRGKNSQSKVLAAPDGNRLNPGPHIPDMVLQGLRDADECLSAGNTAEAHRIIRRLLGQDDTDEPSNVRPRRRTVHRAS